jgi:hypothetical protein
LDEDDDGVLFLQRASEGSTCRLLLIHFPAMAYRNNKHDKLFVLNLIDDTVRANPDAPCRTACQLLTSRRPWIISQRMDCRSDAAAGLGIQLGELFLR